MARTLAQHLCAPALVAGFVAIAAIPAHALTMKECGAKYEAAKAAGSLKEKTWQEFRKAECGAGSTASVSPVQPRTGAGPGAGGAAGTPSAITGNTRFPSAVSSKYSQESPGKARMQTCLDQYRANKVSNSNGGMRWIQKGGGYYSECNKHLKG